MKTILKSSIAILFITLMSGTVNAQDVKAGFKGGFNLTNLYADEVDDKNLRPGFNGGMFLQAPIGDNIAFQTELLYTTAGNKSAYDIASFNGDVDFNLNYLQMPFMIVVKFAEVWEFHGGTYAAYLLNANVDVTGDASFNEELDRDNFNAWDFGMATGLGVNIGKAQVGARFNLGLVQIANDDENASSAVTREILGDSRNAGGQIYFALGF